MAGPDVAGLRKALDENDKKHLLGVWAEQPFFALFCPDQDGVERPISVLFGDEVALLISLTEDQATNLISSVDSGDFGKPTVKAVPLWELARLAYSDGGTLALVSESILFQRSTLLLLGYTVLLESGKGEPTYCRIKTISLEGEAGVDMAPGCVQQWSFTSGTKADKAPRLIFDDSLDWHQNPYLPRLPGEAEPASTLSAQERAVFDSRARPSFTNVSPPKKTANVGDGREPATNQALPDEYLSGPTQIYSLVEEYLFPVAKRLKLEVRPIGTDLTQFDIQYLDEAYTINGIRITPVSLYKESIRIDQLGDLPCQLPSAPGLHPVPGALKGQFNRYLAWGMFAESLRFDGSFNFLGGQLRNLLCATPDNGDTPFFCNPEDRRFPYLARFNCAGKAVPVMVLGAQGDHYVCNPLECAEIPEEQVPVDMPRREDLIVNGFMRLWELSGSVLLPTDYLDCPERLYKGVHLSARYMLSDARTEIAMLSHALKGGRAA
ncbi:hypothetical protein [Marinobacter sp. HN1S83]|uniref:hypothetical protein n=1 Tax=Marinobacter sp. HN1S83 TaxID=3382301 RepID=UPI00387B4155